MARKCGNSAADSGSHLPISVSALFSMTPTSHTPLVYAFKAALLCSRVRAQLKAAAYILIRLPSAFWNRSTVSTVLDTDRQPSVSFNKPYIMVSTTSSDQTSTDLDLQVNGTAANKEKNLEVKPGMISDIKNLYQTKPDSRGKSTWVDKYPDDLEEAAENAETARYALLIRNKKCYDGRKKLQIDSIVVQSPLLKSVLGTVLKNYPGITTSLDRLTFQAPFEPFVHRWSQFSEAVRTEEDSETKAHLDLFYGTLELELTDAIKARDDFILNGVITYDTCWMIFEPGTIVFAIEDKQKIAVRLTNASYAQTRCGNTYRLNCEYVDWDGENFGFRNTTLNIWEFRGTAKITALSAFPLKYHAAIDRVREELIRRGEIFAKLHGYHYKHYQGIASAKGPWGPIMYNVSWPRWNQRGDADDTPVQVDSRIIIDTYAWNRFNPNDRVSVSSLSKTKGALAVVADTDDDDSDEDYDEYSDDEYNSEYDSEYVSNDGGSRACNIKEGQDVSATLTNDQLLLCGATLKGYSLKNKKWRTLIRLSNP